jgi:hypothetical protein
LAAPQDSDSYLDPADFRSTGPRPAPDRDVPVKRGLPGFRRSRTKATPDPRSTPGVPPGGLPEPTPVGTQPHQISAPLPHPTPMTAPIAPPRPVTPHPSAPGYPVPDHSTQGAPHPAALPHLIAPAFSPVPPPTAPAPRSAPQGTPRTRKNASPDPFTGPAEGTRPTGERPNGDRPTGERASSDRTDGRSGKRAADREDPSGRRPARGNEAPVRKKDEDFVDWVSGLGND